MAKLSVDITDLGSFKIYFDRMKSIISYIEQKSNKNELDKRLIEIQREFEESMSK